MVYKLRSVQGWLEECEGRAAPGSPASSISTRRNGNSPRYTFEGILINGGID